MVWAHNEDWGSRLETGGGRTDMNISLEMKKVVPDNMPKWKDDGMSKDDVDDDDTKIVSASLHYNNTFCLIIFFILRVIIISISVSLILTECQFPKIHFEA